MSSPESDISVVVCCYNSSSRLPETIKHLAEQNILSDFKWEIIIIDNASTDATEFVAKQELQKTVNIDYKVVNEQNKGLARARERGIKESKYGIILFCDDDNHLEPDYLEKAYTLMTNRQEVGVLGGLIKPKLAYYPGKWIEAMYPAMGIGARGLNEGYTDWVFGAGMVTRKKIVKELENRTIKLALSGRTGSKQTAGEDAEWCELVKFIGYKIYYNPAMVVYHYMQEHRLKKSFFLKGYSTVYSSVYLWILATLVNSKSKTSANKYYKSFFWKKISDAFFYLPRIVVGRYKFFCLLSFYQSMLIVFWMLFRRKRFYKIYQTIVSNLGI